MSDTTGWARDDTGTYWETIGTYDFQIYKEGALWVLDFSFEHIATRQTLRECQILAHDTARLWSGSDE